jgi:hypothetical protein
LQHPDRNRVAGDLLARFPDFGAVVINPAGGLNDQDERQRDDQNHGRACDQRVSPENGGIHYSLSDG